ncbi:MAG: polysaccharide deacetylase family protein, partial [Chloroflexi bacterium]|nr:polysaccharide deacetylase family protein [Chloroflexota bacterium]
RYDLRTARGKWRLYHHACRAAEEIPSGHPDEVVDDLVRQMGVPAPERPGDAFMNWQEVGILGRHPLVELGSHTVNHSVTPRLSLGVLWRELVDSKSRIEKEAEVRVSSFAYPYGRAGDYPPEVFPLLQQAGYRCAVTAGEGPNPPTQHPFELKRVPIDGTDSWPVFVTKAAGMMFR